MPPKSKFTKDEITAAALQIVREHGSGALTARALGTQLGSSACPIFTVFQSMEEVQGAVHAAAKALYKDYVEKGLAETPAFKGVGTRYILFAENEPKLFQLLFMAEQERVPGLASVLPQIDESYDKILFSITEGYGIPLASAERLYRHLWIYTHGIATLSATKMCRFRAEEISEMMTEIFISLLRKMNEEKSNG